MKISWASDIHLNFLSDKDRIQFIKDLNASPTDAILITGDIGEYDSKFFFLKEIDKYVSKPTFFVLGNHDYYQTQNKSVKMIREELSSVRFKHAMWLQKYGFLELDDDTIIIGVDSWADGREGDILNSPVFMNDHRYIDDFHKEGEKIRDKRLYTDYELKKSLAYKEVIAEKHKELADKDAQTLKEALEKCITEHIKKVIIATHVPPFKEGSRYEGKIANSDYLPFYCSKVTGEVILEVVKQHPEVKFLSLSGHSHHEANYSPVPNLQCRTAEAAYHFPKFEIINIEDIK